MSGRRACQLAFYWGAACHSHAVPAAPLLLLLLLHSPTLLLFSSFFFFVVNGPFNGITGLFNSPLLETCLSNSLPKKRNVGKTKRKFLQEQFQKCKSASAGIYLYREMQLFRNAKGEVSLFKFRPGLYLLWRNYRKARATSEIPPDLKKEMSDKELDESKRYYCTISDTKTELPPLPGTFVNVWLRSVAELRKDKRSALVRGVGRLFRHNPSHTAPGENLVKKHRLTPSLCGLSRTALLVEAYLCPGLFCKISWKMGVILDDSYQYSYQSVVFHRLIICNATRSSQPSRSIGFNFALRLTGGQEFLYSPGSGVGVWLHLVRSVCRLLDTDNCEKQKQKQKAKQTNKQKQTNEPMQHGVGTPPSLSPRTFPHITRQMTSNDININKKDTKQQQQQQQQQTYLVLCMLLEHTDDQLNCLQHVHNT
eukprot:gene8829-6212_t